MVQCIFIHDYGEFGDPLFGLKNMVQCMIIHDYGEFQDPLFTSTVHPNL